MADRARWVKIPEYCYGQKIFQWVIMPESPLRGGSTSPEWWVNMLRNLHYLRLFLKSNLFPEVFLMPRGLVTVLLFYSIPASKTLSNFNVGILFFVIVNTSLMMMLGLMFHKEKPALIEFPDKQAETLNLPEE